MKILHIINSMGNGGAESVLYRLVTNDLKNQHIIISLFDGHFYNNKLHKDNIKHYIIAKKFNLLWFIKIIKLPLLIIYLKPNIVQTWMYHSNLIGGFFAYILFFKKIFWNVRHSNFDKKIELKYKFVLYISSFLSKIVPNKIIYCSKSSMHYHHSIGFETSKSLLIYNGFKDISKDIDLKFKNQFKKKYKITSNTILLGNIGRWHKQKDHNNLFLSLSLIKKNKKNINFKLILIGNNISKKNNELINLINFYKLKKNIIIIDQTQEIYNIYSVIDISISSSAFGEGFSNFLSESMICGTPCIATDVGDSKSIINKFGWLVMPNNSFDLYNTIYKAIEIKKNVNKWKNIKLNSKKYILNHYSLVKMINKYKKYWNEK